MSPSELRSVTVRAARVRRAILDRDASIRKASAAGWSLRDIAEASGLSHMGISKIVNRDTEEPV